MEKEGNDELRRHFPRQSLRVSFEAAARFDAASGVVADCKWPAREKVPGLLISAASDANVRQLR